MTVTALERWPRPATLGTLHDVAVRKPDEQLPCRMNDEDLWFAESPDDLELAKSLCQGCVVRDLCLEGALQRREEWGVWGGELLLKGTVIPFKRKPGRPRKHDRAA